MKGVEGMELEYLQGKNYIVYENLARKMGLEAAAFLGYLISVDEENTGIKHPYNWEASK